MLQTISKLQLLDVVAIKEDLPDGNLLAGQVGTIVEFLAPEVYEVEFSDNDGQTYAMLPLHSSQLLQLKYSCKPKDTTMSNTINQHGQGDNIAGDKVGGDKVAGDKFTGDKVAGDKVAGNKNASITEILQLIASMRETAAQFPEDIRDGVFTEIQDVEEEIKKPENQRDKGKLSQRITALIAAGTAIMIQIPAAADFTNNVTDLAQIVGVEIPMRSGQ